MKLVFKPAMRKQTREQMLKEFVAAGHPRDVVEHILDEEAKNEIFLDTTNTYQVSVGREKHGFGLEQHVELWHLSIKRTDRGPIHDWRIFQEIKNALLGEECEAVELYPAESRLVDTANQYHLYGFKDTLIRFPFGFPKRAVVNTPNVPRVVQRPRAPEEVSLPDTSVEGNKRHEKG